MLTTTNNISYTENGAVGYKTTGKELVDINFSISSMRNMDEPTIRVKYSKVFDEDKLLAVKWLFYARDCRSGVGERRLFRICFDFLSKNHTEIANAVLKLIPEYGRWDDLLGLLDGNLQDQVFEIIKEQLEDDKIKIKDNKPISLCAKWMPSVNTSSKNTKKMAYILVKKFNYNEKKYRKMLAEMRSYLKVIEVSMSANKWDEINYSAVPSKANLLYKKAFLKNDSERRLEYLDQLKTGKSKIHSDVLFPHDIAHKYGIYGSSVDDTLEELWKALPDYVNGNGNTICVVDTSGSMCSCASRNSSVTCMEVAYALGIYFSERSSGKYKDKFITFSSRPELVDFSYAKSLREKLNIIKSHSLCDNTNIEAVFDLILNYAINNQFPQNELPNNILILSDCEFDSMVDIGNYRKPNEAFFVNMMEKYKSHGYLLPRLVFWNICGRSGTIPMKENSMGVALVSGFSATIVKMVLSNKTDPFDCLLEQLNCERYQPVEDALKKNY